MSNAKRTPVVRYDRERLVKEPNLRSMQFNCRLSQKDLERLDALAIRLELTRAGVVRYLLKQASNEG